MGNRGPQLFAVSPGIAPPEDSQRRQHQKFSSSRNERFPAWMLVRTSGHREACSEVICLFLKEGRQPLGP